MPANTAPIFTANGVIGQAVITQASTNTSSATAGTVGTNSFVVFTAGSNGAFIQKVRFMSVATAPTTGVATVLRLFYSTVNTGATTTSNTTLLSEIAVPAIASDNATSGTNYYDVMLNIAMPATTYLLVSQHTAQTANQNWVALGIGGNY